jgi:hypothetical protein
MAWPPQLRFKQEWAPPGSTETLTGNGQLIAVIADADRPDNGHTVAISRPGVRYTGVEAAVHGWQTWALLAQCRWHKPGGKGADLNKIRARIHQAGLD